MGWGARRINQSDGVDRKQKGGGFEGMHEARWSRCVLEKLSGQVGTGSGRGLSRVGE